MPSARILTRADAPGVRALLQSDPVLTVFVASRVDAGVLDAHGPGDLWGYPSERPVSLLHAGSNLVPVHTDAAARRAFASRVGSRRTCVAIVGVVDEVGPLYEELCRVGADQYGRPRAIRERQPVLAMDSVPELPADPRVQPVGVRHFDSYFDAAVAMYTEELGENPLHTNPHGYRRYVRSLVEGGRAFGIVEDGRVIFKADIGAVGNGVAQVQGVWVHPELRGRGLAAPAMASVTRRIVEGGRVASLYVNDFNAPALATYRRCGYTERGVFTTILY